MGLLADAWLDLRVKYALMSDPFLGSGDISTSTHDRIVELRGEVPMEAQRTIAEALAYQLGAEEVRNRIRVMHMVHAPMTAVPPAYVPRPALIPARMEVPRTARQHRAARRSWRRARV